MNGLMVKLEDGTSRPPTETELAVYRTLARGTNRGVGAIERARAARDRSVIGELVRRCAALERRVVELQAERTEASDAV